jgi:sarcosine oxidase/L-pipecolate oxidase
MDYGSNSLCMKLAIDAIHLWEEWNKEIAADDLDPIYHNMGMLAFSTNGEYSESDKQGLKILEKLAMLSLLKN